MRYYETPWECIDYFREEYEFLSNFYPTKAVFSCVVPTNFDLITGELEKMED